MLTLSIAQLPNTEERVDMLNRPPNRLGKEQRRRNSQRHGKRLDEHHYLIFHVYRLPHTIVRTDKILTIALAPGCDG